jgi:superfamily II DNA/RNA helicase
VFVTKLCWLLRNCCLQINLLQQRKPQLLVATPGRLLDLLDSGALSLGITSLVVLDEADKMLSVGFEPQLQRLKALLLERPAPSAAAAGSTEPSSGKKKGKKQKKQVLVPEAAASGQQCQVLLFSATLPTAVRQTANGWLKAGYASVSCSADADAISNTITQVGT